MVVALLGSRHLLKVGLFSDCLFRALAKAQRPMGIYISILNVDFYLTNIVRPNAIVFVGISFLKGTRLSRSVRLKFRGP